MLRKVLDRESQVKSNLIKRLVDCVKELQFKYAAHKGATLTNDEATNLLCWILEAVFIHGLKGTFLKSVTSVFQTRDNAPPEPSFWEFVLIFCHQEVIININRLSYISTDVGRCRAWLRLALNDGLLISYIQMMLKDKNLLKDYYKPNAFLRDAEMCDMLKSYLYGIESYDFQLASNSSLLNTWNSGPLSLVGLWTTSSPYESITQGVDVAENMDSRDLQVLPSLRSGRSSPIVQNPPYVVSLRSTLLDEEAALREILYSKPSSSRQHSRPSSISSTPPTEQILSTYQPLQPSDFNSNHQVDANARQSPSPKMQSDMIEVSVDSSSAEQSDISKSEPVEDSPIPGSVGPENSYDEVSESCESATALIVREIPNGLEGVTEATPINSAYGEEVSYDLLLMQTCRKPVGTPIPESFLDGMFRSTSGMMDGENRTPTPVSPIEKLGFEVVPSNCGISLGMRMSQVQSFLERIPKEVGLDQQDYKCKYCDRPIGMIYGPAKFCALTGNYFCHDCHINDESVIPSRIIFNWDFDKYFVSKRAKEILQDAYDQPMFDLNVLNRSIYNEIEEFEEVKILRMKLKSIVLYLKTCKESDAINEVTKDLWPKEHLFEDIHLYSIADLLGVPNRSLGSSLSKLVSFGRSHVVNCEVCTLKGFICEICKDAKVLFPFDLESNYKCPSCGAVFHSTCLNYKKPCPRCQRWKSTSASEEIVSCL